MRTVTRKYQTRRAERRNVETSSAAGPRLSYPVRARGAGDGDGRRCGRHRCAWPVAVSRFPVSGGRQTHCGRTRAREQGTLGRRKPNGNPTAETRRRRGCRSPGNLQSVVPALRVARGGFPTAECPRHGARKRWPGSDSGRDSETIAGDENAENADGSRSRDDAAIGGGTRWSSASATGFERRGRSSNSCATEWRGRDTFGPCGSYRAAVAAATATTAARPKGRARRTAAVDLETRTPPPRRPPRTRDAVWRSSFLFFERAMEGIEKKFLPITTDKHNTNKRIRVYFTDYIDFIRYVSVSNCDVSPARKRFGGIQ